MQEPAPLRFGANSARKSTAPNTRQRPRWVIVLQVVAVVGAAFGVGSFAARLPGHYADLQRICTGTVCSYGQLSPVAAQSFQTLGLSLGGYGILRVSITVATALTWFIVAAVLAWRKPHDRLALLVALWFVFAGTATITGAFGLGSGSTIQGHEFSARAVNLLAEFGLILLVFALFPTQRFTPRLAFWLLIGFGCFVAGPSPIGSSLTLPFRFGTLAGLALAQLYHLWRVSGPTQRQRTTWTSVGMTVLIGLAVVLLVITQVRPSLTSLAVLTFYGAVIGMEVIQLSRYWGVASPVERQQTKWIAFGISLFGGMAAALLAPAILMPSLGKSGSFYETIHTLVLIVASLLLPFAITFAILRYRLWDIDVLINRTLVYGSLSGILGALYAGLIIGLERLAAAINTQASDPVVLVISTLVIFALFNPVRQRIQSIIDRRFYRRKYDAEKTLAAFSATLQNQVDLEQVREQVLAVVQETIQPAHASLWLRKTERHLIEQAQRLEPQGQAPKKLSDG
jgi:hypothetical protein